MALEVVQVAPENIHGDAFAASAMTKGTFVVLSGTFSAADVAALPAGQKDKPGFATSGDKKLIQAYDATLANRGPAYPIDKRIFIPEDADLDSAFETVKAGEQCLYYTAGEFRSSEFTDLTTTVVYGDYLKLSASGTLTDETSLKLATNSSAARVISLDDDHASPGDRRLHFRLVNAGV